MKNPRTIKLGKGEVIVVSCTSIDCPERHGGKCWFADGRTKQSRQVKQGWQDFLDGKGVL